MSDNIVYEITQMMQDKNILQKDMTDAAELISNMFNERYFNRLHSALQTHHINMQKKPPREVQLLRALKEFRPESEHKNIDSFIDMLLVAGSIKKFQEDIRQTTVNSISIQAKPHIETHSPIHPDGIYDVDSNCLTNKNKRQDSFDFPSMYMILALFMMN